MSSGTHGFGVHERRVRSTCRAASRMSLVTAAGCASIAKCGESTSIVWERARFAMKRCAAGGIARSCVATMNQDGSVLHAGGPDASVTAAFASGRWIAAIVAAAAAG